MMRKALLLLAVGAVSAVLSAPATRAAEATPVLVELFTSQGCSSCPPADALLGELAKRDGVIALAYHVDYWDYLGWKDTFAQPAFTQRQRSYAPQVDRQHIKRRLRGSFTPEMVIQGRDSLIGSAARTVEARIEAHAATPAVAKVALKSEGADLIVNLTPARGQAADTRVMMARFRPKIDVTIDRGENAGRTLTYHRVVTELSQIGRWDGKAGQTLRVSNVDGPVVVFLQRGNAGPVLAAAERR